VANWPWLSENSEKQKKGGLGSCHRIFFRARSAARVKKKYCATPFCIIFLDNFLIKNKEGRNVV
jgi:hypothetical protein